MSQLRFNTPRLEAIALWPELARAAVEDRNKLAQMLNAKVPDEFPPEIMADVVTSSGTNSANIVPAS